MSIVLLDTIADLKKALGLARDGILLEDDLDVIEVDTDQFDRKRRDAEVLCTLAANCSGKALDLGTAQGRSAFKLATNMPAGKVYTVNILPEQYQKGTAITQLMKREEIGAFYRERGIQNIEQLFADTMRWEMPTEISDLSMVFIDACHDEDYVYHDSRLVYPRIKDGGFLLWHDFTPIFRRKYDWINSSMRGVERFLQELDEEPEIFNLKYSWIGILRKNAAVKRIYTSQIPHAPAVKNEKTVEKSMNSLRYLIAYTAHDRARMEEEEAHCARLRAMGYDVEGMCVSIPIPGGLWHFDRLDREWRARNPELLSMYTDLENRLRQKDVFIAWTGAMLHPDFLAGLNTYNVFICSDDPESSDTLSRPAAQYFDYAFTRNIACVDMYRAFGCAQYAWLPPGIPEELIDPTLTVDGILEGRREIEIAMFSERISGLSDRAQRLERLHTAFPQAVLRGKGWAGGFVSKAEMRAIYRQTKIGWNLHNSIGPTNSRLVTLPALGVMQICDNRENLGKIFRLNEEVAGFDTLLECIDLTNYYLSHDMERRKIAAAGYQRAIQEYSEKAEWERLIRTIEPFCRKKLALRKSLPRESATPMLRHLNEIYLHLGCGEDYWAGYINVDSASSAVADLRMDYTRVDEVFSQGTVSEINMIHSLNYLNLWQARKFFRMARGLLRPGGRLVIETVNVEKAMRKALENSASGRFADYLEGIRALHAFGMDDMQAERDYTPYAFSWSPWHLKEELEKAGFEGILDLPPRTHVSWRDMRFEASVPSQEPKAEVAQLERSIPVNAEKGNGKVLLALDQKMGHVTFQARGMALKETLERHGWTVFTLDVRQAGLEETLRVASTCDVVYLLKVQSLDLVRKLKDAARASILFDLTDALWKDHHRSFGWQDIDQILASVDGIVSDNPYVAAYGKRLNPNVYLVPTATQVELFDSLRESAPPRDPGKLVIGWVGSQGTVGALHAVREVLEQLGRNHPEVELRVLGADPDSLPEFRNIPVTVMQRYDQDEMVREMLKMDIGIFPPPIDLEDYIIRGGLKAFIYMSAGIPCVCQNAGEVADVIRDGETGLLANSAEEWYQKLELLIRSPETRRRIGRNALETIRPNHSLEGVALKLEMAFLSVMKTRQKKAKTSVKKPRILLIADVPNWIFDRHCRTLQRLLSEEFDFVIKYAGEEYREEEYDLIYPLEWNLLPAEKIHNPYKYVTGIRSHLTWESYDLKDVQAYLKSHYQQVHVVSRKIYNVFYPTLPDVVYLTHGVDTEFFKPGTQVDRQRENLRIGWAGNRLSAGKKGYAEILEPLGEMPGVEFVYCGYDSRQLSQEEMRDFYDSLDVYICASVTEGNNNPLLEAASMERAIITTDVGTVPEYLVNGESALIVPRSLDSFVKAVETLRDDPSLRVKLGRNARRSLLTGGWDWRVKASQFRMFFLLALERARKAAAGPGPHEKDSGLPGLETCLEKAASAHKRGDEQEASEWLEKALEHSPNDVEIINVYGNILMRLGNLNEAYQQFLKASNLAPGLPVGYVNQAAVLYVKGQYQKAQKVLQFALQMKPDDPPALQLKGLIEEAEKKVEGENNASPLVSVVIPTHNRPKMLPVAIESVLKQTYTNFEIFVVNDAGEDVRDVVDAFRDPRIHYLVHPKNKGLGAARNSGIIASSGKYLTYLDDDDQFYPDHLETLVSFLEKTDFKAAYTDAYRAKQKKVGDTYTTFDRDLVYSIDFNADLLLVQNIFPVLCIMHERECLEKAGLFDETLSVYEDWDLWIRMSRYYPFAHLKQVTAEYTWRVDGSTMSSSRSGFLDLLPALYKKYSGFTEGRPDIRQQQQQVLADSERKMKYNRAEWALNKILIEDDLDAALEKYRDDLTPEMVELLKDHADQARQQGDAKKAAWIEGIGVTIQGILQRKSNTRGGVRVMDDRLELLKRIVESDDVEAALKDSEDKFDQDFLELIRVIAVKNREEWNTDAANALDVMAEYVENVLKKR